MATLKEDLDAKINELRQLVSNCSTSAVAGWCFAQLVLGQQQKKDVSLGSPDRQVAFLLGVMLSTSEPATPGDLTSAAWERIMKLLNAISLAYMQLYVPAEDEFRKLTDEWRKTREVAMLAFLHYFNTGLVASVEQVKERIAAYLTPFDEDLESMIGIRSRDAVTICQFISDRLQADLDNFQASAKEMVQAWNLMGSPGSLADPELQDLCQPASREWLTTKVSAVFSTLRGLGQIKFADIAAAFPNTSQAYWERFSVSRGQGAIIEYPTEPSLFDTRPLIRIDADTAFCITGNSLFLAVLKASEGALAANSLRERFFRARDKSLELQVAKCARALLGSDATIWEGACESQDGQNEHDVIAFDDRICIVFEAKASPSKAPLRDPDKAFIRIRDAFRSRGGIQKAFDQGNRVIQRLLKEPAVTFFNRHGEELGSLSKSSRFAICACVTRDDFGPLATNLKLLLEKAESELYPWAVNILDLSALAEAWQYLRYGSKELRDYLQQRLQLHGRVLSAYELDYAGYFLRHGSFGTIRRQHDSLFSLSIDYSDVFDDIHRHLHAGGPPVNIIAKEPVVWDYRKSLAAGRPVFVRTSRSNGKVGRNDPCPCGSGRKFKQCHGR